MPRPTETGRSMCPACWRAWDASETPPNTEPAGPDQVEGKLVATPMQCVVCRQRWLRVVDTETGRARWGPQ